MEWIKCSERLPSKETPVLIVRNGVLTIGEIRTETPDWESTYQAFDYWDNPENDGQDWNWSEVTHWMPIPLPPTE